MKTRNKLMAAAVMLVISILMMSTASFAWFSISTNPEISTINTTVIANQNLEIALAGGKIPLNQSAVGDASAENKNTTWGNIVDLGNIANLQLKPAALNAAANGLQYPEYDTDGRIKTPLKDLTPKATSGITTYHIGAGTDVWAVRVDFWLRTNVAGTISFSEAADRIGASATAGSGSFLKTADGKAPASSVKILVATGTAVDGAANAEAQTEYNFATNVTFTGTGLSNDVAVAATDGKLTGTIATVNDSNINKCIPVSVLLYLDGTAVTNADVAVATNLTLNMQFKNGGIGDSPNVMSPN